MTTSALSFWSVRSGESPISLTPEQKVDLAKLLERWSQQAQLELMVEIRNGGALGRLKNDGLGLIHTRERLQLLFGPAAMLELFTDKKSVVARVRIPQLASESSPS